MDGTGEEISLTQMEHNFPSPGGTEINWKKELEGNSRGNLREPSPDHPVVFPREVSLAFQFCLPGLEFLLHPAQNSN